MPRRQPFTSLMSFQCTVKNRPLLYKLISTPYKIMYYPDGGVKVAIDPQSRRRVE